MPFTPFHGGFGLACKGPFARRFSFTIFVATQVVIDFESAYFLITQQHPVHRFFHTFVGATVVCLAVAILLRRPCEAGLRIASVVVGDRLVRWLDLHPEISRPVAVRSALAGMIGHVIPDAIMHMDSRPFAPFSDANPFLGAVSMWSLHIVLCILGGLGLGWMLFGSLRRGRKQADPAPCTTDAA